MKIQVGSIFLNKTVKYLAPCLQAYGKEFITLYEAVFKAAVGIGDIVVVKTGVSYTQHIFLLVDIDKSKGHFNTFLRYTKENEMYEDDYAYDDIATGRFHMIIIRLPEECYKPIIQFRKSQFSKMFNENEVEEWFKKEEVKGVLLRDHNYAIAHAKNLNELFNSTITKEDLEGEYDFPISSKDETFN